MTRFAPTPLRSHPTAPIGAAPADPRIRRPQSVLAFLAALVLAGGLGAMPKAHAASANPATAPITVELEQAKVVKNADGSEQLLPASSVRPGDMLEYRATYTNTSDKTVNGLLASLPVPEGMDYVRESAQGQDYPAQAATADGHFAGEPLMRDVKQADGSIRQEPVPYDQYRSLRWRVGELQPKANVMVKARVRVSTALPAPVIGTESGSPGRTQPAYPDR